MFRFIGLALFLTARIAVGTKIVASATSLRSKFAAKHAAHSFISSLEFKYVLRICNAYPYSYPMDVYLGKNKLTHDAIPYTKCGEFSPSLKAGDKLDFKVQDSSAGSFTVSDLPENNAVMALIIYRHDTRSTAVSFESHVFSNLLNAQVAVLDTYRGSAQAVPKIQDMKPLKEGEKEDVRRSEELRYNSVVAVNQGLYEVVLKDSAEETKARRRLVAINKESYLVLRCGVEAEEGQSYPQELMVFPESDPSALGGAARSSIFAALFATLAFMLY